MQAGVADEEALHSAADDAATLALPELTRRLPSLGVLANSATLIGLLGTITGLITAISGVGVADAAQRSAYLAAGISEALHTTAFGLIIAIPTLLIQGWLNSRVEEIAENVDRVEHPPRQGARAGVGRRRARRRRFPSLVSPPAVRRCRAAGAQGGGD